MNEKEIAKKNNKIIIIQFDCIELFLNFRLSFSLANLWKKLLNLKNEAFQKKIKLSFIKKISG